MNQLSAAIESSKYSTKSNGHLRLMKAHPKIIDRILDAIRPAETVCVVGHIRPDGDCIGSQLGLTLALHNAGKKVTCWNQDRMPAKLAFLDPKKLVGSPRAGEE